MNRHDRELRRLIDEFQDGRMPFEEFHNGFISCWTRMPERALAPEARERWNEVYGMVLTAVPDQMASHNFGRGVIGEAELRIRLRRHPLLAGPR